MKFKDIPGYEGSYKISRDGVIKSVERKIFIKANNGFGTLKEITLKTAINNDGYKTASLTNGKKRKTYSVHQLVAMTYLNHTPCGMELVVDHIDNDKTNNNVNNLQLISNRENASKDRPRKNSKYVGVVKNNESGRWYSYITVKGKQIFLGSFSKDFQANEMYQKALLLVSENNHKELSELVKRQRQKVKESYKSKYTGVYKSCSPGKWYSQIYFKGKTISLGTFKSELDAHLSRERFIKQNK